MASKSQEGMLNNAYVLLPLMEIAQKELHPVAQLTYQELWEQFPSQSQKLCK